MLSNSYKSVHVIRITCISPHTIIFIISSLRCYLYFWVACLFLQAIMAFVDTGNVNLQCRQASNSCTTDTAHCKEMTVYTIPALSYAWEIPHQIYFLLHIAAFKLNSNSTDKIWLSQVYVEIYIWNVYKISQIIMKNVTYTFKLKIFVNNTLDLTCDKILVYKTIQNHLFVARSVCLCQRRLKNVEYMMIFAMIILVFPTHKFTDWLTIWLYFISYDGTLKNLMVNYSI